MKILLYLLQKRAHISVESNEKWSIYDTIFDKVLRGIVRMRDSFYDSY